MKTANYELDIYTGDDKPSWLVGFNSNMEKIDSEMKQIESAGELNKSQYEALETRLTTDESNIQKNTTDITDLKTKNVTNTSNIEALQLAMENVQNDLIIQNTSVKQVQTDVSQLKTDMTTVKQQIEGINGELTEVNETATDAKNTAETAQVTAEQAQTTAQTLQEDVTTAKNIATTANQKADDANTTATNAANNANVALEVAGQAKSTADEAKSTADEAKTDIGELSRYFTPKTSNFNKLNQDNVAITKKATKFVNRGFVLISMSTVNNDIETHGTLILPLSIVPINTTSASVEPKVFPVELTQYSSKNGGSVQKLTVFVRMLGYVSSSGDIEIVLQPSPITSTLIPDSATIAWRMCFIDGLSV